MSRSHAQQVALAVVPKVTGGLSLIFSGGIAVTILRDASRRRLTYHRLLLGISLVDLSASTWMFLSTWPIPRGETDILWAVGTTGTCTAQGFFLQFGVSAPFYNASLSIYYFLVIVRKWKEQDIQKIEWLLHGFPLGWALVSSVTGLVLQVYDNAGLWCWVAARYPVFRWTAYYGPLWLMIAVATAACIAIYRHVRQFAIKESVRLWTTTTAAAGETTTATGSSQPIASQRRVSLRQQRQQLEALQSRQFEEISKELSAPFSLDFDDYDGSNDNDDREGNASAEEDTPHNNSSRTMSAPVEHRRVVVPAAFAAQLQQNRVIHRQERRLREIAHQCFWYAAAFFINFGALSIIRFWQAVDPSSEIWYPLLLVAALTVPMQGLPNFLIYARPKLRRMARKAAAKGCFGCGRGRSERGANGEANGPWWYRLAQSLSERHRDHHESEQSAPRRANPKRSRGNSSAAVVQFNPGMVNEMCERNHVNIDLEKSEENVVLVVVDTPDEGRQWRIETNANHEKTHVPSRSESPLQQVDEAGQEDDPPDTGHDRE